MILLTNVPDLNFSKQGWGITVPFHPEEFGCFMLIDLSIPQILQSYQEEGAFTKLHKR